MDIHSCFHFLCAPPTTDGTCIISPHIIDPVAPFNHLYSTGQCHLYNAVPSILFGVGLFAKYIVCSPRHSFLCSASDWFLSLLFKQQCTFNRQPAILLEWNFVINTESALLVLKRWAHYDYQYQTQQYSFQLIDGASRDKTWLTPVDATLSAIAKCQQDTVLLIVGSRHLYSPCRESCCLLLNDTRTRLDIGSLA